MRHWRGLVLQRIFALLLTASFFLAPLSILIPTKASALGVPTVDSVQNALLAEIAAASAAIAGAQLEQAAMATQLTIKEIVLDGVIYALINTLIDQIGQEMVKWISSGFDGGPAFIQDPSGFAMGVGNAASGRLIADLGLEHFLCDPFQLPNLQLALSLGYGSARNQRQYYCTFTRVGQNFANAADAMKNFVSGKFGEGGGWDQWAQVSVRGQNVFSTRIAAGMSIDSRLAAILGSEKSQLDWGKGFLSAKTTQGYIKTPGTYIENQLNSIAGSGNRRIEIADEISEIIGALVGLLMKSLFTGLAGDGGQTSFRTSYSGNASFTGDDFQNFRNSNLLLKPDTFTLSIPSIPGAPQAILAAPQIAEQGPDTYDPEGGGTNDAQVAGKAIDGNKDGTTGSTAIAMTISLAERDLFGYPWWRARFEQALPFTRFTLYEDINSADHLDIANVVFKFYRDGFLNGRPILEQVTTSMSGTPIDQVECDIRYFNQSGVLVILRDVKPCRIGFDPTTNKPYETGYYDVLFDEPISAKFVRLEKDTWQFTSNGRLYLSLNEVVFYTRPGPLIQEIPSGSVVVGQPFDLMAGISATDYSGEAVPPANITYQVKAPGGAFAPDANGDGRGDFDSTDPNIVTGNWTVYYSARDRFGIEGSVMTRTIQVTKAPTGTFTPAAPTWNPYTGSVAWAATSPNSTVSQGSTFNVFNGVTARDSAGNTLTNLTSPGVNATYTLNGQSQAYLDTNIPGNWVVTYRATDRLGASATLTRTVLVRSKPVLSGVSNVTISRNTAFDPMSGVSALDADGNAVANITTAFWHPNGTPIGAFDSSITGNWTIVYTATDTFGAAVTASRIVTVNP